VQPAPPFLLYDGDCGFCRKWARWLQRRAGGIELVPFQSVDDLSLFGLVDEDVRTASYWIDEDGRPHRGHRSFARALRRATGPWPLVGVALELPVIRTLAAIAYRNVARNRHRLPAPDEPTIP